jgi:alpha-glucuronidase
MRAIQYSLFEDTLDQQFEKWLSSRHGQLVLEAATARARALFAAGFRRYGIKALLEAFRFDRALQFGPTSENFYLNNNYASRLAREIMRANPDLAGFFEVRRLHDLRGPRAKRAVVLVPIM